MLLTAEHINKNYGMKQLLADVSLYMNERERIGIIGINGTGKSTFLRILAGAEEPDSGTVLFDPNIKVAYLEQNPALSDELTVLEQVFDRFSPEFRALNEFEAKSMLTKLGITDLEQKVGTLSGGQRKRVALAAALIHPADILILDEPTNHLDSDTITWLEQRLRSYSGGIIMVTHDRWFLENVVTRIVELSRGQLYSYEANYSKYLELKAQRAEMAEASERKRQSILRKEYRWIMRGARARGTKSKERIERYENLKNKEAPTSEERVQITSASERLGKKTVELTNISKSFGDKTVIRNFSHNILRTDRIGIVGKNGVGKSTLLNIIAGIIEPDAGSVSVGATVKIGYFSQEGKELDLARRAYDLVREAAEQVVTKEGTFTASKMLERFLFDSDKQFAPISSLSGGERRRLYLLSILMTAPNILLLDEPTNDLDIETLTILEDYLETFPGAVISVSHDRYFLDKTADFIFEVRDNGEIIKYVGNYSDYIEKREPVISEKKVSAPKKEAAPRQQKLRFSFKEQREFETIDGEIAQLEAELARLETDISLCGSDYLKLQELMEAKEKTDALLQEKMERWIYLNELAEQIELQKN